MCQDKGVLNVCTFKSVIQHLSTASSQLTTIPAPNFEHTNTYTAIIWWLLMPGISSRIHVWYPGWSFHTWYVPSSICGSLFVYLSFSFPQLPRRFLGSCYPPKVIAIYRLGLICQSQPVRVRSGGRRLGAAFGSRRHIQRKTQWQQDEIELQIWFGSRAGNFCGRFSISVCRLERGGLRLSDSSYLAQILAVPTPMSILCH